MNKVILRTALFAALALFSSGSLAIKTEGKTSSSVTASVVFHAFIDVTAPGNGWYAQPQELTQWGGQHTPYTLELPINIESNVDAFLISLENPVELVNQNDPKTRFKDVRVTLGNDTHPALTLTTLPQKVVSTATPSAANIWLELWQLSFSATPPAGDLTTTAGTYVGTLAMTFEPVVVTP